MRKLYSLIFSLLLFTGAAFGQTLKGHVYDADNNGEVDMHGETF